MTDMIFGKEGLAKFLGDGSHNYQKKFAKMIASGNVKLRAGKVGEIWIAHDDWCKVFNGGVCDCDPDISYTERPDGKLQ